MRAAAPLATLFFPDALAVPESSYPAGFESNEAIMAAEALSETLHAPTRPNISLYDDKVAEKRETGDREDRGGVWGKLGIFTGEDERFAYVSTTPLTDVILRNKRLTCLETSSVTVGRNDYEPGVSV